MLAVLDLSNQLGKLGEGLAAHAGLTTQQWLVLLQVAGDPNFHVPDGRAVPAKGGVLGSEIALARGVSRASVSTLVAQLLGKGLIRRIQPAGSPALYEDRVDDSDQYVILVAEMLVEG